MFGEILRTVKAVADIADATVGMVVRPVRDGAEFMADNLRELVEDDDRAN